jgi:hypothetical protein
MPNWFHGDVEISHTNSTKMEEFFAFYEEYKDKLIDENMYINEDIDVGGLFNNKFAPLSKGKKQEDGHIWDWKVAIEEWGSKWGIGKIKCWGINNKKLCISFDSAWTMPNKMFKQFHDKGFKVEATGWEIGVCFMARFKDGKTDTKDLETEELMEFAKKECEDDWDDEMIAEDMWDYAEDYCNWYWDNH